MQNSVGIQHFLTCLFICLLVPLREAFLLVRFPLFVLVVDAAIDATPSALLTTSASSSLGEVI